MVASCSKQGITHDNMLGAELEAVLAILLLMA